MSEWIPGFDAGRRPVACSLIFAFAGPRLLILTDGEEALVPRLEQLSPGLLEAANPIYLGSLDGEGCFVLTLDGEPEGDGLVFSGLRELFPRLPEPIMAVAGRASQTVEWLLAHAFCGRCGTPTQASETELARVCPGCGALHFPRITPAVIMLVERGDRMLLARNARFRGGHFSCLAGFVEPGETLEQAVAREVREEVGLEIEDIRYFASQPWPFPSQLMIGFTAQYAGGTLTLQPSEIAEADWFGPEDLPPVPGPFTIARRLIDSFLDRHRGG